ncbi:MAG TPA: SAM-dependent methyltransferase, partial [Orrella sp.]
MLNPLASLVEKKLAAMPVAVRLQMPDGQWLGPKDARVEFVAKTTSALKNLAAGDIGKVGEDYVEGRVEINSPMRDLMAAANALLPNSPVEAAQQGAFSAIIKRLMSVWRHSIERDAKQIEFHY